MVKVLVFGMTENPGGVESVIINYYRNIDRTKVQFDFLCNSYEKVAFEDELLKLGGKCIHFPARSQNFREYKQKLNGFFKEHAKEYVAIWVNVCSLANIDYLILAKKYGIKNRIIHSHNSQNMDSALRGLLHKFNKRRIDKYATDFFSCSDDATKWFYKTSLQDKVLLINNAIDVSHMKYNPTKREAIRMENGLTDAYVIGNVGRLHFQKNQTFMLDIMKEFTKKHKDAVLVLVGQGEDKEALVKKAKSLEIEDNIRFVGVQKDIVGWLSAFDVFLFPSLFEGLSIAALEAQANGIPTLASKDVIPKEVRLNDNFTFYSLDEGAIKWSDKLEYIKDNVSREKFETIIDKFRNNGFDIKEEAQKLQDYFVKGL